MVALQPDRPHDPHLGAALAASIPRFPSGDAATTRNGIPPLRWRMESDSALSASSRSSLSRDSRLGMPSSGRSSSAFTRPLLRCCRTPRLFGDADPSTAAAVGPCPGHHCPSSPAHLGDRRARRLWPPTPPCLGESCGRLPATGVPWRIPHLVADPYLQLVGSPSQTASCRRGPPASRSGDGSVAAVLARAAAKSTSSSRHGARPTAPPHRRCRCRSRSQVCDGTAVPSSARR